MGTCPIRLFLRDGYLGTKVVIFTQKQAFFMLKMI